jgi:hypothetical protein
LPMNVDSNLTYNPSIFNGRICKCRR